MLVTLALVIPLIGSAAEKSVVGHGASSQSMRALHADRATAEHIASLESRDEAVRALLSFREGLDPDAALSMIRATVPGATIEMVVLAIDHAAGIRSRHPRRWRV